MSYRIVGDWGTSRLRLFRIENGAVIDRAEGAGIGAIDTPPEAVLRAAIARWRGDGDPLDIALCGMVGSRNGWIEVPYVSCPADAEAWAAGAARASLDDIPVAITAGLATDGVAPDVMRGEETQIFGAIARDAALATGRHVIALPGTHSKWAEIADGRIVDFRTYLTGETFALLRDHSILARVAAGQAIDPADDSAGFDDGLARAADGGLLGALFTARSAQLLHGRSPGWALGYLSGLLIGREIAEATVTLAPGSVVPVVGAPALTARYDKALAAHGFAAQAIDGDAAALAGLALLETRP